MPFGNDRLSNRELIRPQAPGFPTPLGQAAEAPHASENPYFDNEEPSDGRTDQWLS